MVEKLKVVFVGELHNRVLQRSYLLEHLTSNLWVESDSAMLELVEWRVESLVDIQKLFLHPLDLRLILDLALLQRANLYLNLRQIGLPTLYVLLSLHKEDLLLLVMLLNGFG